MNVRPRRNDYLFMLFDDDLLTAYGVLSRVLVPFGLGVLVAVLVEEGDDHVAHAGGDGRGAW